MKEKGIEVLDKYDINVIRTGKVRGATLLITDSGPMILKECSRTQKRIEYEVKIHQIIGECRGIYSDALVANREGGYITADANQVPYIIKKWYEGTECIPTDSKSVCNSAQLLAKLHVMLYGKIDNADIVSGGNLIEKYEKYNREMKRARIFIRNKHHKSDFELELMNGFEAFYDSCINTTQLLKKSDYLAMYEGSQNNREMVHGDYNYHNVIAVDDGYALVNFDNACVNLRIIDVYNYLRKVMEKNNWDEGLGMKLLESYDKYRNISNEEKKLLKILLMYPEKFRKVVNYYYNGNKAWIPGKNMEKLILAHKQMKLREKFVQYL